ncbi:MAG: uracil-DNA glycosylase [Candidatus Nomurabacteria bacterium]|nr:uracil-DNA glycosylase [Candidatus Nomurabacteria bacterium]
MDESWAKVFSDANLTEKIHQMGDFLRKERESGRQFLPAPNNIFRAFKTPINHVKVLIIGQDPYPTPSHPVGLSFSVAETVKVLPPSLINIFQELSDDLKKPAPKTGDLSRWAEQGVMLLNRVLTVGVGSPASHRGKGWEEVTETAVKALNNRKQKPFAAILWGSDARSLKHLLTNAHVIESPHPSPLSAHRGFFGSKPFSRTNQFLEEQGETPIDW